MTQWKITTEDLQTYKKLITKEQEILNTLLSSNEDISKVYYNENIIILQFQAGKPITSTYLKELENIMDYQSYTIETVTTEEQFLKIKYHEQVLQLNIRL